MPTTNVMNLENKKVGEIDLNDAVFGTEVKEHLFWEVIRSQQAARRSGSAHAKTRSEINATGAKMSRQKGSGGARHGSRRAPIFVGGGVTFPPRTKTYKVRVPKKVRRAALCSALSLRLSEGQLFVLDSFELPGPKTKGLAEVLRRLEIEDAVIVDAENRNLYLSARNLPGVTFLPVAGLNLLDLLRHRSVLVTREGVQGIEGRLDK